jgi:hypothetical protein
MDVVNKGLVEDQLRGAASLVHVAVHTADVVQRAEFGDRCRQLHVCRS